MKANNQNANLSYSYIDNNIYQIEESKQIFNDDDSQKITLVDNIHKRHGTANTLANSRLFRKQATSMQTPLFAKTNNHRKGSVVVDSKSSERIAIDQFKLNTVKIQTKEEETNPATVLNPLDSQTEQETNLRAQNRRQIYRSRQDLKSSKSQPGFATGNEMEDQNVQPLFSQRGKDSENYSDGWISASSNNDQRTGDSPPDHGLRARRNDEPNLLSISEEEKSNKLEVNQDDQRLAEFIDLVHQKKREAEDRELQGMFEGEERRRARQNLKKLQAKKKQFLAEVN